MNIKERAECLIANKKSQISASEVYAVYNEITGKRDKVSLCQSCIIKRLRFIENWLSE